MKIPFYIWLLCFLGCGHVAYGQTDSLNQAKTGDPIFLVVEEPAHAIGGLQAVYKELATIQRYPEDAKQKKIEGRVFVEFIVNKDGSLSDIKVIRGLLPSCDEEAIRAIKKLKKWIPGKQNGEAVRSKFNLAVIFKLTKS